MDNVKNAAVAYRVKMSQFQNNLTDGNERGLKCQCFTVLDPLKVSLPHFLKSKRGAVTLFPFEHLKLQQRKKEKVFYGKKEQQSLEPKATHNQRTFFLKKSKNYSHTPKLKTSLEYT